MISIGIQDSPGLTEACQGFLAEVGDWTGACVRDLSAEPPTNGHDQATFTVAWAPYIEATNDVRALGFMVQLRDKIRDHFVATGAWRHGYWTMQEAHHGTEHFELFLGTLWGLGPGDAATVEQLVDAAEHFGNWVPEIPPWFDWGAGLFRSFHFGTEGVKPAPGTRVNVADHLRCVNICMIAHRMTGEQRYLDLSVLYAGRWADAVNAADRLPVGLTEDGGVYSLPQESDAVYRAFAGQAPDLAQDVDRAENLLASGAVNTWLALWGTTADTRFRQAAEKVTDVVATQLGDPDAGAGADVIRACRRWTNDRRYDRAVLDTVRELAPFGFSALSIDPAPERQGRASGIGKRKDMPIWCEDGAPRRHSPMLLALAAEITEDERLATRSVDIGRAYLALARKAYAHGREHGCSARSVSAIARGHGRENNAGVVTAVLAPVMKHFSVAV